MEYSDINKTKLFEDVMNFHGKDMPVNMALEEFAELIQAINKYFNRQTCDEAYIATEIADVELCIEHLQDIIGDNKIDELTEVATANLVLTKPTHDYIKTCATGILVVCGYFHYSKYDWQELTTALCEMKILCNTLRNVVGHDIVDSQKELKLVRMYNRICGVGDEGNNNG